MRTRMSGGVGAGRAILPATRLGFAVVSKPLGMFVHIPHLSVVELNELLPRVAVRTSKRRIKITDPDFKWPVISPCISGSVAFASELIQTQASLSEVVQCLP